MVSPGTGKQIIYLTGFMGSGKSTIGPIVANTIGFSHLDLDREVEKLENKSIRQIFDSAGEGYFRQIETAVLLNISRYKNHVISLGGGSLEKAENLSIVKETGILIYLKIDPDVLIGRLRNRKDRPLLKNSDHHEISREQLADKIHSMMEKRESNYAEADLVIEIKNERLGISVDRIVGALRPYIA